MIRKVGLRLTLDNEVFEIPYDAEHHAEGVVYPYRSLVAHPEIIEEIPEVEDQPLLRKLLHAINAPDGMLESARVEHWYGKHEGRVIHVAAVGVFFRNRNRFANIDEYMLFAGRMLQAAHSSPAFVNDEDAVQLELQNAKLTEEKTQGWIMDLFIFGRGQDAASSDADLGKKLNSLSHLWRPGFA
ncbi:hypothetical protein [Halomonas sp. WWR20]